MHMMFETLMSDWGLCQPILFDSTMCDAAASIALAMDLGTLPAEAEPQHEQQNPADIEYVDWAHQDTWERPADEQAGDHHQQQQQLAPSRSGLEPKVIGLLVNLYRYGGRSHDVSLWDRVRKSADKLYYSRPNISKQVDQAMRHR